MRKLIAVLATLATAMAVLAVGLVLPAHASLTSPANGAVLRGPVTISETGGYDDSTLDHCSWFGGSGGDTRLQLVNSGGGVVWEQFWNTGGSRSATIDTRNYPNGSYTVRGIITVRKNDGFLGLGCKNVTETSTRSVTIDNGTALTITEAPANAPQNTSVTVAARLTDLHGGTAMANRPVAFSLSGRSGNVTANTNANGVATATLPLNGPPRNATITAAFAQTTYYKGSSRTSAITITKNGSQTTLAAPEPVVFGQPATFTATVARTNGSSTPTGTVQFTVNGSSYGAPVAVSGGTASLGGVDDLPAGSHTVGARYSGDANLETSTAANRTLVVGKAPTSTALTSTGSPTVSGEPVTFTATVDVVAPGAGNPGGSVRFEVDGTPTGTSVPLDGDTAEVTLTNLAPGNHQVTATYTGNANFAESSSAELTHGVDRAATSLELRTSNDDPVAGEPVTFTADLSVVAPGAGNPGGHVQFAVDGEALGAPVPVVNGTATSPTARLGAGDHLVTADYQGDARYAGSQDQIDLEVDTARTRTEVTTSPNPSVVGQPVTIRAVVTTVAPGSGTPEGVVEFRIGDEPVGTFRPLTDGEAELALDDLARGTHQVQARYLSGHADFAASTSDPVSHTVNRAATRTTVTTSGSPSVFGQRVTFTASVAVQAPGAGSPTGTITFTDGDTVLGSEPVSSATGGQASITVDDLDIGQHAVTATYDGDDSFQGSNGAVSHRVNRAQTSVVVSSSANPSQSGQGVTFTAEVDAVAPGAGDPTGTVQFTVNGAPLGGARPVEDGVATSPQFSALAPGVYRVAATYSGERRFVGSEGSLDQGAGQEVTKGETEVSLGSDDPVAAFGAPVTLTTTVDALPPASRRPTGAVQFWNGDVLLGATMLEPAGPEQATASFVTSTLAPGTHEIRTVYVGNFNFEGGEAFTTQVVEGVPTVVGVESAGPVTFGDDVVLTAVVGEVVPAPGEPSGTVTFTSGGGVLGTAPVETVDGRSQATLTVPGLGAGNHQVRAEYSGDATFSGGESAPYTQVVHRAASRLEPEVVVQQPGNMLGRVRATLTGNNDAPLVGKELVFRVVHLGTGELDYICTAVTDQSGYAWCDVPFQIPAMMHSGYDVLFAGSEDYLPAEAHGLYTMPGPAS